MIRPRRIAVDMGSTRTRVFEEKRGLLYSQPTVIARDIVSGKTIALGDEALEMSGRMPEGVDIIWPLQSGVIADFQATSSILSHVLRHSLGRVRLRKPEAIISVSSSATSTEKRALIDAGRDVGLAQVFLIKSAVAASIGAGLPIHEPRGNFVIDIGGGTTEIGVFSLGGIVAEHAVRSGGKVFDDAIVRCVRREFGIVIGREELKHIKHNFAEFTRDGAQTMHIHGQDVVQGLPKTAVINNRHLQPYLEAAMEKIYQAIRQVMEQTPPDLLSDSIKHGIILTGGGSLLSGLDSHLADRFKVAFIRPEQPRLVVVKGVHGAARHIDQYKRSLIS